MCTPVQPKSTEVLPQFRPVHISTPTHTLQSHGTKAAESGLGTWSLSSGVLEGLRINYVITLPRALTKKSQGFISTLGEATTDRQFYFIVILSLSYCISNAAQKRLNVNATC